MNMYCGNRLSGIEFTKGMMTQERNLAMFPALRARRSLAESENDPNDLAYGTKRYPVPPPD